jgi:hypothetical protein
MKNNGKNGIVRRYGSASATVRARVQADLIRSGVFIGPSVEGINMKYVKVVSGTVVDRKPSFA